MARNGSGTYNRIAGTPYVYNTVIDQVVVNSEFDDIATALTGSLAKDGQTTPTANLPMGGYLHTNVGAATARTHYARASQVQDGDLTELGSVAGTNTITATAAMTLAAYAVGQVFQFVPANDNTGAATLNINSIGAGAIQLNGRALVGGELQAGVPVSVFVSATTPVFQIVGNGAFLLDSIRTEIASAATVDFSAVNGRYFSVTGTETTTAITLEDGRSVTAVAAAAWPLTHGTSLILPGAANYTCAAGDILHFHGESGGVVRVEIENQALVPAVVAQATAEAGTDTIPRLWSAQRVAQAIAALATSGGLIAVTTFTANGTWTKNASTKKVVVFGVGGGGAGGGSTMSGRGAEGGSAGSMVWNYSASPPASASVTIGAGGSGSSGATGGAGGTTSVASGLMSAAGGWGGTTNTDSFGLHGESGYLYGGGPKTSNGAGNAAPPNSGAGGGGAYGATYAGGDGGSGLVIIWEFA